MKVSACVEKNNVQAFKTTAKMDLANLGNQYTQQSCETFYTGLNILVASGCAAMDPSSVHTATIACDSGEYCNDIVKDSFLASSQCMNSNECPVVESNQETPVICCDFYREKLKSKCSKYDEKKMKKFIDTQKDLQNCRDSMCYGAGSTLHVTKITIIISSLIAVCMCHFL
jgi:hypothetical protein